MGLTTRAAPTLTDIEAARARIAGIARVTPVYPSETLSRRVGRPVQVKAENLQRTGAFKIRGAVNTIASLSAEERAAGVVAASAGNHGQAVAWAARQAGISATIFMPQDSPMAKVDATRNYGARVELVGVGFDESLAAAQELVESSGATFVHAFEDERVIAGQGTIGLELAEQLPDLGTLVVPIGGGGLASGIAIALRELRPAVRLVGVQAEAVSPFAGNTEHGFTIAEGIAVKQPGTLTTAILGDLLDDVVTVTDEQISYAIVLLLERMKLLVEGAGAAPVAALLAGKARGRRGGLRDPLGRQHRRDHADPGDAARADGGRSLSRRPHAAGRPPGRADQAARARRRRARQRRLGRASPRGHGAPDRADRGRADAGNARQGPLRRAARRAGARGLSRGAHQLTSPARLS